MRNSFYSWQWADDSTANTSFLKFQAALFSRMTKCVVVPTRPIRNPALNNIAVVGSCLFRLLCFLTKNNQDNRFLLSHSTQRSFAFRSSPSRQRRSTRVSWRSWRWRHARAGNAENVENRGSSGGVEENARHFPGDPKHGEHPREKTIQRLGS